MTLILFVAFLGLMLIGVPVAIASTSWKPNDSHVDGCTKAVAPR